MISMKQIHRLFVSDNLSWELLKLGRKIAKKITCTHSSTSSHSSQFGLQPVEIVNQIGERQYRLLLDKLLGNCSDDCLSDELLTTMLKYAIDGNNENITLLTSCKSEEIIQPDKYSGNLSIASIKLDMEELQSGRLLTNMINAIHQSERYDCIIIPDPRLASVLLLNKELLLAISRLCRGDLLIALWVSHKQTRLDNVFEKPLDSRNLADGFIFKDGFVRKHGHLNGFFEIESLFAWIEEERFSNLKQAVSRIHIQRGLYFMDEEMSTYRYQAPYLSAIYSFRKIPDRKWILLP